MYLYSVCCEYLCGSLGEHIALDTAVVGNGYAGVVVLLIEVVRKALCSASYGVYIHAVCSCTDNTSQTACTKFQITVKSIVYSFAVALYLVELSFKVGVFLGILAPKVIKFHF